MGTRSLTILPGYDGETAVMYRQFDGYPEGHGIELARLLAGKREVNGFGVDDDAHAVFNGPADLAAAIVATFKNEAGLGNVYLHPAGSRDLGEEYRYTITTGKGGVKVKVESGYGTEWETIFTGTPEEMFPWIEGLGTE